MNSKYKYDPEDFEGMLNISDDIRLFYALLEEYRADNTKVKRFALEKHSQDFFFTIKHRELEGRLSHTVAEEMREYLREQLDD